MPHNHMPREIACFNHLSFLTYDQFQRANKSTIRAIRRKMTKRFETTIFETTRIISTYLSYLYNQSRRGKSVQTHSKSEFHLFLDKNEFCLSFPTS